MAPPLPFAVIGNPENRRVTMFQDALARAGLPLATVVPWHELARDARALDRVPAGPCLLRIDSFGEDFAVEKLLLLRGYDAACADPGGPVVLLPEAIDELAEDRGRVIAPRQHHHGLLAVLDDLERWLTTRPDVRCLTPIAAIRELFDKRLTSRTFERIGVPVPQALHEAAGNVATLREQARDVGLRELYVKLSCGSSASCLALWRIGPSSDVVLTTMETANGGFYNSLRLRRYERPADVERVLSFLLCEGAHVEAAIEKARLDGRHTDCRVLVVAGEPAFTVVRTSAHPITNLHLGGQRGDLAALRALCPADVFERAMESCRAIGRHYATWHVGIDLLFERGFEGHRVVEANAFGDLLPGLSRGGLDTYGWEIQAVLDASAKDPP